LAFWTNCDPVQMDRLFRQSKLYRKVKGAAYLQRTIEQAIKSTPNRYRPSQPGSLAGVASAQAMAAGSGGWEYTPTPGQRDHGERSRWGHPWLTAAQL
jgi:hypothetical protein